MTERHGPTSVYRLFGHAGDLLYVGMAVDPKVRFAAHAADKPWWPEVTRQAVEWHPTRSEAEKAERAAILSESPRYNAVKAPPADRARCQIRVRLNDESVARLDDLRGPATRTAYALYLLSQQIDRAAEGVHP